MLPGLDLTARRAKQECPNVLESMSGSVRDLRTPECQRIIKQRGAALIDCVQPSNQIGNLFGIPTVHHGHLRVRHAVLGVRNSVMIQLNGSAVHRAFRCAITLRDGGVAQPDTC